MISALLAMSLNLGPAASIPVVGVDGGSVQVTGTITTTPGTGAVTSTQLPAALDGSGFLKVHEQGAGAVTSTQLPAALDGSGFLMTHEQGTAAVSGMVTANQGTANATPWNQNVAQVGGSAVVTGGATGTLAIGGTGANNASITQNPLLVGAEAVSAQSNPTAASGGNLRRVATDLTGNVYVINNGPNHFNCTLTSLAGSLAQCGGTPGSGLRIYITDIIVQTTTTTAGTWQIKYGTGTNCGTGTTALTGWAMLAPISTAQPQVIALNSPLIPPQATEVCVIGTTTNTINITLSGYIAP